MSLLNNQQKQLLFDYCIGLTSEEEAAEAEALISSNEEAAEIHSKLKAALAPLESAEFEPCPDELAEGTIWRLNNLARSSQLRLQQLLASEQAREVTTTSRLWWNLSKVAAAAAVILIVLGTWFAPFGFARHKYRQHQCRMQLARIFEGIDQYSSEHDGQMPAVASAAGAPWWKLGDQGSNNHSNTRHIWLLVKGDYVNPADFVCPGKRQKLAIRLDPSVVKNYNDFPSRGHITYSFRIRCGKSQEKTAQGRKVLMADLNPLFEQLPGDYSEPFKLEPPIDLLIHNSTNHKRRGQNVLFGDGSVEFVKVRSIGVAEDDIFTLQDTDTYKGVEVPSCETDAFLAP
jgi:prepilin-type processing-associated H-X9-DG protein